MLITTWSTPISCTVAVEVGLDLSVLDAVLEVGLDPVLHVMVQLRSAMHQRDARAVPPQIERRNGGGVLAPDHQHVGVVVRMRLAVVVRDLGQILAGNAELVRQIVIAGRNDHLSRAVVMRAASAVGGRDAEIPVLAHDGLDPLVLANVERVVLGDLAVVLQRFLARGLLLGGGERNVADLQQFRRGEKHHVRRDSGTASSPGIPCRAR